MPHDTPGLHRPVSVRNADPAYEATHCVEGSIWVNIRCASDYIRWLLFTVTCTRIAIAYPSISKVYVCITLNETYKNDNNNEGEKYCTAVLSRNKYSVSHALFLVSNFLIFYSYEYSACIRAGWEAFSPKLCQAQMRHAIATRMSHTWCLV